MTNAQRLAALAGREFLPAARSHRQLMQQIQQRRDTMQRNRDEQRAAELTAAFVLILCALYLGAVLMAGAEQ